MKIYIIGTGGVGGYFGGILAKAQNDVIFVSRGKFYDAMKHRGLTLNTVDGDFKIKPVKVIDSINKITNPDLVLVCVKTYDTEDISKQLATVILDNTVVITFQNGIENDKKIKESLTKGKVFPGVAYVISSKGEDGVINQTGGLKRLVFGDRKGENDEKLNEISNLFKNSGIDTILSDDIELDLWKKFIFINAYAGFTSLCRANIGCIRNDEVVYRLYNRCVEENISVAKKLRISLPNTIFDDIITMTNNTSPDSKSSLLIDIENNRKNEIETLNGTLVRLAHEAGIDVPVNETIYSAIKLLDQDTAKTEHVFGK